MALINSVLLWLMKKRLYQIELFMHFPHEVQEDWFKKLLHTAKNTEWGQKFDYASICTIEQYRERVPISTYEGLKPYIDRLREGEQNLLWPSNINWFAKSSGTTGDKSKFIPVSREALEECHYKGGKDMLSLYFNNSPESTIFSGKLLGLGGSRTPDDSRHDTFHGDVSAILMQNLPFWVELLRTPSISIALMNEWEEKLERMAIITKDEDVTAISGVPSWTLLLIKRILEITGKENIGDIWPNLQLFTHGGVSFTPYRAQYKAIMPKSTYYLETYNASEGFFGIQDRKNADDMLLMLDYGIFYEFIPFDELEAEYPKVIGLGDVKCGENYALLISTNAGLWRYLIGDTVTFTSTNPFRIKITGRTKNFINAFGEELIIDNAEKALRKACDRTGAAITDYTAAPIFISNETNGAHEWLIEFSKPPANLEYFIELFDNALKSLNSDYEAKRYRNMILGPPQVRSMPAGTFYNWMKSKGRLGGQYKVPRLSNERLYIEEILSHPY